MLESRLRRLLDHEPVSRKQIVHGGENFKL